MGEGDGQEGDGDEEGDGQEGDGQEGRGQEEAEGHEEGCEGGDRVSSRSASTIAYGVRDNDQASGGAFRVCGSSVFAWRVDFVSGVHASFEHALKRVPLLLWRGSVAPRGFVHSSLLEGLVVSVGQSPCGCSSRCH